MLDGIFAEKLFRLTSCTIHFRNHVVQAGEYLMICTTVVFGITGNPKKIGFFPSK
jgi:hypothetical protein